MYKVRKRFYQNGVTHIPGEIYTNLESHTRPEAMIHGGFLEWLPGEDPKPVMVEIPVVIEELEEEIEVSSWVDTDNFIEESALDQLDKPVKKALGRPRKATS